MAWADIVRNPYPHNRRDFKYVWNNYRTGKRQRIGGSELTKNEVIALPTRMYKLLRAWAEMTVAGKSRADKDRPLFFHTRMLGHRGKNRQGLTQTQYLSLWKAFVGQKKIASALKLWKVIPDKFRKEGLNNKRKIGNLTLADWRSIGLTSFYMEWRLGKGPFSWIRPDDLDTFLEHLALVEATSECLDVGILLNRFAQVFHLRYIHIGLQQRLANLHEHLIHHLLVDNSCLRHLLERACDLGAKVGEHHG